MPYPAGGGIVMLYQLRPGACDQSFGVHVARMAGMPREVADEAERYLAQLQAGGEATEEGEATEDAGVKPAAGVEEEEEEDSQHEQRLSGRASASGMEDEEDDEEDV